MIEELLDRCFLFDGLSESDRKLLRPLFSHCSYQTEDIVFRQGDPAELLYIVMEGKVRIFFKPEDAPELTVATINPGGVFGWSAVFGSEDYTSGAICEADVNLLCVRGDDLKKLCEENPETGILIIERLAAVVAERLRNTHAQVVELLTVGLRNGGNSKQTLK